MSLDDLAAIVLRVEGKLDRLIAALAEEAGDEQERTLDGEPVPREREQGQSLG